eukprot:CAMPEP_0114276152 /NCGR_PEP_ID=MMETSP0059-20121206/84_1 /TAXON_ID=36894 /ORGANISM="Pyramimonas parkeae, Strain CCMP726" /LENGTH=544 /DNA_ID=CAMNT_0001396131 /DNA_START=66 /DNA_END=1701 /DNA_ORIENTATION=-
MKARTDSDSAVIDLSHEDEVSLLKGTERQSGSINIRVDRNEGHGSRNSKRQRSEQSACVLERAACPLRLLRTKGIASSYNEGTVSLDDIFQGKVDFAIVGNFMIDPVWLLSACPQLSSIPCIQVFVHHYEAASDLLDLPNFRMHRPPLPTLGYHHTKMFILVFSDDTPGIWTRIRVCVHTANLIYSDFNNKTQGCWFQDFPKKGPAASASTPRFEDELVEYMSKLGWSGATWGAEDGARSFCVQDLRKFDFSAAQVRLVASVPGTFRGPHMHKWGHLKLRALLQAEQFEPEFEGAPAVCQFSSLGSLDANWLEDFHQSLSSGRNKPLDTPLRPGRLQLIWPTVNNVRLSSEGYQAGCSIPGNKKNVLKETTVGRGKLQRREKLLLGLMHSWVANDSGRQHAMPHIKSYTRYSDSDPSHLAWFCLTSANLSKAAWGQTQLQGRQFSIHSYELGVLFAPSTLKKRMQTNPWANGADSVGEDHGGQNANICNWTAYLQVPYSLPPKPYVDGEDSPWIVDADIIHPLKDAWGNCQVGLRENYYGKLQD